MSDPQPPPPGPGQRSSRRSAGRTAQAKASEAGSPHDEWRSTVSGLTYGQARTAMDLAIAQLQSDDLEVEQMASLYRRALACADRCESLLAEVELEVVQLDPSNLIERPSPEDNP